MDKEFVPRVWTGHGNLWIEQDEYRLKVLKAGVGENPSRFSIESELYVL